MDSKKCSSNPQEKENRGNKEKTQNKMADISTNISMIRLGVNYLNTPIKDQIGRVDLKT